MDSSGRTLVCSVLFLDIVEYSKKPVAEQLQIKQAFNQALEKALEQVAPRDRIILDTGDGAAVTFLGDPEDALFASLSMRDRVAPLPVRLGVNLGPVRLVKDLNGQVNIIGDGINVSQRVMSFSQPGQLLVSRSFYEVVSCLSRDYATLFHHEGQRTDKHVREHDVYSVAAGAPSARRLSDTLSQTHGNGAKLPWWRGNGPLGVRRTALIAAPAAFLLIIAGGYGARAMTQAPATPADPRTAAAVPASRIAVAPESAKAAAAPAQIPAAEPAPEKPAAKKPVARVEKKPERKAGRGARVELAIAPWGEVLVDGKSRGISPPLRELEILPGPHTIEIRNSTFPAHVERVQVKPGEAVKIRHRFK
jgi:hypothetical protein